MENYLKISANPRQMEFCTRVNSLKIAYPFYTSDYSDKPMKAGEIQSVLQKQSKVQKL